MRAGVVRALGNKPEWTIRRNEKVDGDTVIIDAELKGVLSKHNALLVVGQTADSEGVVCFKLISLTLGNNIQLSLSGISEDSYKPLHPQYVSAGLTGTVEEKRTREIEEFKKRITDQFR
jgi:hypothetical protein